MAAFIEVSKTWRWIIGILFFILLTYFTIQFFMVQSIDPILEQGTKTAINKASKGVYRVEFKDFKYNLVTSTLTINGFKLIPDSTRYYYLLSVDSIGPDLFTVYVPEIRIKRINLFHLFSSASLNVHDLILNNPVVEVINHPEAVSDTTEGFDLKNLFEGQFKRLVIGEIKLSKLIVKYKVEKEDAPPPMIVERVNFRLFNLDVDSSSLHDPNKLLYTDDFEFSIEDFSYKMPDSLYSVKVKEMRLSQSEAKIIIDSLEVIPRYNPYRFTKIVGIETDRIALKTQRIELSHIDMGALLNHQKLISGLLTIENSNIDVFRDKRYPENVHRRPKSLHKALKELEFYLKLDTVKVVKANIVYKEHGEESNHAGHISFNNLYASIYGLTNDSLLIHQEKIIADVQAHLYGSNLIKAKLVFDIGDPKGSYDFSGTLSAMALNQFNNFILPSVHVNIEDGKLHEATFYAKVNDDHAVGKMNFRYDDLKIKVLDKDGENGLKQKITSFVANTFVVKKNNPGSAGLREGIIYYKRPPSKSQFHFWGRMLLTGVASSVGISEKSMKKDEVEVNSRKENKKSKKT